MIAFIRKRLTRNLSAKLILLLLMLLTFAIAMISSLYYWFSSEVILKNVRASTQQSAKQSADYLSLILTVGSDMGQQIFRDALIQDVIQEEAKGGLSVDQKFDHKNAVNDILNNIMYTSSFVHSIYLLREQGVSWGSGLFNASKVMRYTLTERDWYNDIVGGRRDELWLPLQFDPFSGGGENTRLVLTFVKPLRNLATRETAGAILVNVDGQLILQAIERIRLGKTGDFFVVDGDGKVVIASEAERWTKTLEETGLGESLPRIQAEESEFELELDGVRQYAVTRKLDNDWTVVGIVPVGEMIGDIARIQRQIWLYATLLLALASITGYWFSKRITSPLKTLMTQMKEIERSNFNALSTVSSQDEIGQLSRRFNQMVRQIEALIEQVNQVEAKKREAEMRALRHQINPHFLYNTLATIRWMIKFGRKEGAYDGISSLVQLMEASMEKQGVFYRIRDELELLDKYMVIQRFRYDFRIELHVNCDEAIKEVPIPRMLLQPIVENAIFHGLAPKEGGGTVTIAIEQSADMGESALVLRIEDDGVGISPERLPGLLGRSREPKSGMFGIGLNHVHETVQLYYGERSGVEIVSPPGGGTIVTVRLFMKEEMASGI